MSAQTNWVDAGTPPPRDRPGVYEVRDNPDVTPWPEEAWSVREGSERYWDGERWLVWQGGWETNIGQAGLHQWRALGMLKEGTE